MISSGNPSATSGPRAGKTQVAMLSALMAMEMRSSSRWPPVPGGQLLQIGFQVARSRRICMACLMSKRPADVGFTGRLRTSSTVPTWASEGAQALRYRGLGHRQPHGGALEPPSTMAARHSSASESKVRMWGSNSRECRYSISGLMKNHQCNFVIVAKVWVQRRSGCVFGPNLWPNRRF